MTNYPKSNYSKQSRSSTDNNLLKVTGFAGISLSSFFIVGSVNSLLELIIFGAVGYFSYDYLAQKNLTKKANYVVMGVAVLSAIISGGIF
tara:strand:- start:51 stop:320 length:270 start_codon:yes stop_codon:yes gene_type:complete